MDSFGIDYMHSFAAERLISLTPLQNIPDGIPFHFANIHHIEQNHFKHWICESLRKELIHDLAFDFIKELFPLMHR